MEEKRLIPREIIDEICARCSVEDIIGSYVTLKRAGSNLVGLCPFHSEKTPSFTVFPASESFHCFGCGVGGDVISFVMRAENLDYVSAIEFLAAKVSVTIPQDKGDKTDSISRKRVMEMNKEAAKFFRSMLLDERIGREGLEYLSVKRQLSPSTIKHFGLGYAPNDFGMLYNYLKTAGYTDEEMVKGFLCGIGQKTKRPFDMFRNRVMFPIIDLAGNVIAFGGRVMDDSKPKYLNSSDTPAFKKSKNLFALNYAKNYCAEQMILCEGYMDVIALHAAGFQNAVATLGTAITPEQARIMAKYTKKVIITYDSDEAGQKAADKAMRLLGEVGIDMRVLTLIGAKDPDEYIKKFGADKFSVVLEGSRTGFEFKLSNIVSNYDIALPDQKIKAAVDVCGVISQVYSNVERDIYISIAAERLGLAKESLANDTERLRHKNSKEQNRKQSLQIQLATRGISDRINPDSAKNIQAAKAEEAILGMLILYDSFRSGVVNGKISLCSDDFFTDFARRVFDKIYDLQLSDNGFNRNLMGESFSLDEMSRIFRMVRQREELVSNGEDVLLSAIENLKNAKYKSEEAANESLSDLINKKRQNAVKNKNNT